MYRSQGGFSYIELIVTSAIAALVFGGLFSSYETIISIIAESRMKANALALATERIEYIRSLSYSAVGTVSGVPAGTLPQTSTTILNGTSYYERILISYIDDDADGLAGADSNAVTSDYKLVKVEYAWPTRHGTSTIFQTTNIVPIGIETTAGGGTIRVNVFDATVAPVSGAEVRFVNPAFSVDTSRFTGASGEAYLSGAPEGGGYQIYVTKSGYSSDSTYVASSSNPSPVTPVVSVLQSQVSTMNFQIDQVSDLDIFTLQPPVYGNFDDQFLDSSNVASTSNTVVSSSSLHLLATAGLYPASGWAQSVFVVPATLYAWESLENTLTVPTSTSLRVFVYYNQTTPTLVPDSDLPGNSAGFTGGTINLSTLNPSTYPALALRAELGTTNPSLTSTVREWKLTYITNRTPIASVPVSVTSQKLIGVGVSKYQSSITTNGSGKYALSNMEWGAYTINEQSSSYTASEVCPNSPYALPPNADVDLIISLVPTVSYPIRVVVKASDGTPIKDATVKLENGAYSELLQSSTCGQVLFNPPAAGTAYDLTVTKTGYTTVTVNDTEAASAGSVLEVVLVP